jgi:polar amino acid transport system substrate-binding protein
VEGLLRRFIGSLGLLFLVAAAGAPQLVSAQDVAPTGSLRVAIAVGPAASEFWAAHGPTSGAPYGVTVELAKAAAAKLHVPLRLVEYANSGEIVARASQDEWDISFMPADAEREKYVDQGPAYVLYASNYLLRAGSTAQTLDEVDQPGQRVGCIRGTTNSRTLATTLKHASLNIFDKAEDAAEGLRKGELDALAMGRASVTELAKKIPGTRVLEEPFELTSVVIVVPKNHASQRQWAARFVEDSKADGTVRRALDKEGFGDVKVAAPQ